MKRTLIVATTSYAGMGPYVSEIVNTFSPEDDVWYFFHDYEDEFFKKNVKKELHGKSLFYKQANSAKNKLIGLLTNRSSYDSLLLKICTALDCGVDDIMEIVPDGSCLAEKE